MTGRRGLAGRLRAAAVAAAVSLLVAGCAAVFPGLEEETPRQEADRQKKVLAESPDPEARRSAASRLGTLGAPDAVPLLATALRDPDPGVRVAAGDALVDLKDAAQPAVPALRAAVAAETDGRARVDLAWAARKLKLEPAVWVPALTAGLSHPDRLTRYNAALGLLGQAEPPVLFPVVFAEVGGELGRGAGTSPDSAARDLVRVSNDRRLVPMVLAGFAADRPAQRSAAASFVVAFRPPPAEAAPGLVRLLRDPEREVRDRAALSLGPVAHERPPVALAVAPALADALRDAEPPVRRSAAASLRYIPGTRVTVPPLVRTLGDPVADVRSEAAFTLGEYGSLQRLGVDAREAIAPLIAMARTDPEVGVRINALRALAKFERQAAAAVPTLRDLLKDPNERIRDIAAETLSRIERR